MRMLFSKSIFNHFLQVLTEYSDCARIQLLTETSSCEAHCLRFGFVQTSHLETGRTFAVESYLYICSYKYNCLCRTN